MNKVPNLLIIGAAKSGTTSLHFYLDQHPDVFMSKLKEPEYFAYSGKELVPGKEIIKTYEEYISLFSGAKNEKVIGESSPAYLLVQEVPQRVKDVLPNVKILAILRDPVERAFSHFLDHVRRGIEKVKPTSHEFMKTVEYELPYLNVPWEVGQPWPYIRMGLYYSHISRYLHYFDWKRIHICIYDDLLNSPIYLLRNIFRFLEIDPGFAPDINIYHNETFFYYSIFFKKLAQKIGPLADFAPSELKNSLKKLSSKNRYKPQLCADLKKEVQILFEDDTTALQNLLKRKLPWGND